MKNKRILYAASSAEHIRKFHLEIIDSLRALGYEVLTMARGGADFDLPFEKSVLSLKNLSTAQKIRKILKRERFCAIILNTSLASFLVRLALPKRVKKTTKVVNFVHGYLFSPEMSRIKRGFFLFCEMLLRRKTDLVITMNGYDFEMAKKHRLATLGAVNSSGVGITPRTVTRQRGEVRRDVFSGGRFVMTFVGELSKRKNQAFLIKCLPRIRELLGDVRLCLVGDGRERQGLFALAESLSVGRYVIFSGYREDAMDIVSASDLYVSSSLIEGLPLNIIEALSLGKTVLATRIKGHTDLISDGDNGYLFDVGDEAGFIGSVCRILNGDRISPERAGESAQGYGRGERSGEISRILLGVLE